MILEDAKQGGRTQGGTKLSNQSGERKKFFCNVDRPLTKEPVPSSETLCNESLN